jgi:hypothetical protein
MSQLYPYIIKPAVGSMSLIEEVLCNAIWAGIALSKVVGIRAKKGLGSLRLKRIDQSLLLFYVKWV